MKAIIASIKENAGRKWRSLGWSKVREAVPRFEALHYVCLYESF
jgi:hypothetical protein